MDSSPDNDEAHQDCQMVCARLTRRRGIREEPATERFSSHAHQPGIWRIWAGSHRVPTA